jgi:hypothetical protein
MRLVDAGVDERHRHAVPPLDGVRAGRRDVHSHLVPLLAAEVVRLGLRVDARAGGLAAVLATAHLRLVHRLHVVLHRRLRGGDHADGVHLGRKPGVRRDDADAADLGQPSDDRPARVSDELVDVRRQRVRREGDRVRRAARAHSARGRRRTRRK